MSPPEYDHQKSILPNCGYFCHHCTGRSLSWSPSPLSSPSPSFRFHPLPPLHCSKCHFESPYLRVQPPPDTAHEISLSTISVHILPVTARFGHVDITFPYQPMFSVLSLRWSFRFALADREASDCNLQSMQVDNGVKITAARVCCPLPSTLSICQFFPRRPQLKSGRDMISSTPHGDHHSSWGGNV